MPKKCPAEPWRPTYDSRSELNRAFALQQNGDIEQASDIYQTILKKDPMHPDALHLMGKVASQMGDCESAVRLIGEAIQYFPNSDIYYSNLGNALARLNRTGEAVDAYRQALRINPDSVEAINNLATSLKELGRVQESLVCFERALALNPRSVEVYNNMGNALTDLGQIDAAIDAYCQATALKPDYAIAHNNLGSALKLCHRHEEAIASYLRSVAADPGCAEAYNNLGETLADMGHPGKAAPFFEKALELKPDLGLATGNLLYALTRFCAWKQFGDLPQRLDYSTCQAIDSGGNPPEDPFFNLVRHDNPAFNQKVAMAWSSRIARIAKTSDCHFTFDHCRQRSGSKLAIGYLSNNFHDHPMAHLLTGLIDLHDRNQFKIICYSCGPDDQSDYRRRIEEGCDQFCDLNGQDHRTAAQRMYTDQVDILVDLMGHTKGHRMDICALRPAPVQVRYLGMAGTAGADFFDYLIADRNVIPKAHEPFYNEKIVCLPHTYQVNNYRQQGLPEKMDRRQAGLPPDGLVFCSFNQPYKLDRLIFANWMRILKRVSGSILWLQCVSSEVESNLKRAAEEQGVEARRMVFSPRLAKEDHLARLQLADLALDTRTVNGAATTSDALWAGVPVITVRGRHFASRMSASLLSAIGLPELVTSSLEDYEELAVSLALNSDQLNLIRKKIDRNRHSAPLFDTPRVTKNLENAYRQMWQGFVNFQEPNGIIINDPDDKHAW